MSHPMVRTVVGALLLLIVLQGCSGSSGPVGPPPAEALANFAMATTKTADGESGLSTNRFDTTPAGLNRKIVYTAHVALVVDDFDDVPARVVALVKRLDAYVADSNLAGATGESRRAVWKIRVPVAHFEEFVSAAQGLGELQSARTESLDMSEEYFDIDARIRNKTREEEWLLKLLEDRPGKLEDVMAIERALSQAREEMERLQGRLRVLTDLTAMTTVNLSITEIHGYEPPQSPTFAIRVRRAFDGSIDSLQSTGEETVVATAAMAPWLAAVGLSCLPGYIVARAVRRRSRRTNEAAHR
ncbi:MAG TPA: DUF4349 domain-containing protein [Pirellulales bacterium]